MPRPEPDSEPEPEPEPEPEENLGGEEEYEYEYLALSNSYTSTGMQFPTIAHADYSAFQEWTETPSDETKKPPTCEGLEGSSVYEFLTLSSDYTATGDQFPAIAHPDYEAFQNWL